MGVALDVLRPINDLALEDQGLGRVDPDVGQVLQVREQHQQLVAWQRAHGRTGSERAVEDEVVGRVPPPGVLARRPHAEPLVAARGVVVDGLHAGHLDGRGGGLLPAQVCDPGHLGLRRGLDGAARHHAVPGVDGSSADVVALGLPEPLGLPQPSDGEDRRVDLVRGPVLQITLEGPLDATGVGRGPQPSREGGYYEGPGLVDLEEGLVVVHVHHLGLDGVEHEGLAVQRGALGSEVLHVQVPVGLEEVEEGEDEGHEPLAHAPVLGLELLQLGGRGPQEDLLDALARDHGRQLGGDVQAVPDAAEVVEGDVGGVGGRVQSQGVLGHAVRDVIPGDGGLVQGDQGVEGFGDQPEIKDVVDGEGGDYVFLELVGEGHEEVAEREPSAHGQ